MPADAFCRQIDFAGKSKPLTRQCFQFHAQARIWLISRSWSFTVTGSWGLSPHSALSPLPLEMDT